MESVSRERRAESCLWAQSFMAIDRITCEIGW